MIKMFFKHKKRKFEQQFSQQNSYYEQQSNVPKKKRIAKLDSETAYSFKAKMSVLISQYSRKFNMRIPQYVFAFNINLEKQGYNINVIHSAEHKFVLEFNPQLAIENNSKLIEETAKRAVIKLGLLYKGQSPDEQSPEYRYYCKKYNIYNYNNLPEVPYKYFIMRCRECREPFFISLNRPSQKAISSLLKMKLPFHQGQDYSRNDKVHQSELSQVTQEELTNSQAQFYFERMRDFSNYLNKKAKKSKNEFNKRFFIDD